MKYVLQVSTGTFAQCTIDSLTQMKEQLEKLLKMLPVNRVIFGWGKNSAVTKTVLEVCRKYQKQVLLWLPVFADVEHPDTADSMKLLQASGKKSVQTCSGEEFQFICPSSVHNLNQLMASFDELCEDNPVDGLFLDRIRYPSVVYSPIDFFGCQCELCVQKYQKAGIDTDRLHRTVRERFLCKDLSSFAPIALENGRYHYADTDIELLCEIKRQTITGAVQKLVQFFHQRGLLVGIDTFAPSLADLVGQDLQALSGSVDFFKPMMYFHTSAPAGIPFELKAYGDGFAQHIQKLWKADISKPESMSMQLLSTGAGKKCVPGFEVNCIPGICEPKTTDLTKTLRALSETGCEEAVLSWNVLNAPLENLRVFENKNA